MSGSDTFCESIHENKWRKTELKRKILGEIEKLSVGDLVCVEWCDASRGKSLEVGTKIDVNVESWGIYLAVLGQNSKHLILAQNNFRYANGLYDLDYTAIPIQWSIKIIIIRKSYVSTEKAKDLLHSFLIGGRRNERSSRQQKVRNHRGRLG
jgi:hypothetical protein